MGPAANGHSVRRAGRRPAPIGPGVRVQGQQEEGRVDRKDLLALLQLVLCACAVPGGRGRGRHAAGVGAAARAGRLGAQKLPCVSQTGVSIASVEMSSVMDGFASLIADSIAVHGGSSAASSSVGCSSGARADALRAQQIVNQLERKVRHEKQRQQAHQQRVATALARQQRMEESQRRHPSWLLQTRAAAATASASASPHRDWSPEQMRQLSSILLSRNDGVCTCDSSANRRRSSASSSSSSSLIGCCVGRVAHAARTMHRTTDDIINKIQSWEQLAAGRTHAMPASAADEHRSTVTASPSWSSASIADRCERAAVGEEASASGPSTVVPRWSTSQVHDLMVAVRSARDDLAAASHARKRHRQSGCDESESIVPRADPVDPAPSPDISSCELSSRRWCRLAASLRPPQSGATAHAVYRAVVATGGYAIPAEHMTQTPFYFPPQRAYHKQSRFAYEGPTHSDDDGDGAASDDPSPHSSSESSDSCGSPRGGGLRGQNHQQIDPSELLQTVRR